MKHPEAPGFRFGRPISGHNANAPVKPHEATRDVRSTTTDLNSRENKTPVARANTEHGGQAASRLKQRIGSTLRPLALHRRHYGTLRKDFSNHRSHPRARYVRALLVTDDEGSTGHHEQVRRGLHSHGLEAESRR